MPLQIIHQDITKIHCDAIVNPTDCFYSGGGGTDSAIHKAAGKELDDACKSLEAISFGEVKETVAFGLPSKYIIHTMGPVWAGGHRNEAVILRSCYLNALIKAKRLGAKSVAFPLISSGTFGFPKDRVLRIAIDAISDFLFAVDSEMLVYICVIDRQSFELSWDIALKEYLNRSEDIVLEATDTLTSCAPKEKCLSLAEWIKNQDDTFAVTLFKLIDKKGMDDVECYKKANVTKNTFWKIKNSATYKPSKPTVIAFAIALELDIEETEQLLKSAGFTLSHNNTFDMIIEFYIINEVYDIFEINAALYQYGQMCLGC